MKQEKSIEQKIHEAILSDPFCLKAKRSIERLKIIGIKLHLVNNLIKIIIEEPHKSAIEGLELVLSKRIQQIKQSFINQK